MHADMARSARLATIGSAPELQPSALWASVAPRRVARWFDEIILGCASSTPFDPRRVLSTPFSAHRSPSSASSFFPSPSPSPASSPSLSRGTPFAAYPHRRARLANHRRAFLAILLGLINEYRCRGLFMETDLVRNECSATIGRRDAPAHLLAGRGNYLIVLFEFFAPNSA